ncbi:MAG: sugar phosphate isomerase/epimerase [Sphingomonadales bacterium]|nr:MAG: sugar phosphate isomerase/epimerase [Sphingomonadales bacterium]
MILDHLTAASANPIELIQAASHEYYDGVGLFLHNVPGVPGMCEFDILHYPALLRDVRTASESEACTVEIAYPFTLTRKSAPGDFDRALDAAAEIGAKAVNLLVFDREIARRAEAVAGFSARAAARGLAVGLEFYPPSAVRTLGEAVALCDMAGAPTLKLTVDLLHLHRSGGTLEELAAQRGRVLLAQICDAPAAPPDDLFYEAAADRLLPGEGALDPAAFLRACGPDVAVSIEAPCERLAELSPERRARAALRAARGTLENPECR